MTREDEVMKYNCVVSEPGHSGVAYSEPRNIEIHTDSLSEAVCWCLNNKVDARYLEADKHVKKNVEVIRLSYSMIRDLRRTHSELIGGRNRLRLIDGAEADLSGFNKNINEIRSTLSGTISVVRKLKEGYTL